MSRIPREVVEAVRDRTDIVEVVQRHVQLVRRGSTWVGLCPLHQERSPSFHVIPTKQIYHCFGCQKSGDAFRFLMEVTGLSFAEAVRELAVGAGVEVPERALSDDERQAMRQRATLFDVLEEAASWYESQLWTGPEGAPGRAYLQDRAITEVTARAARLGFAPPGWTRLVDHLHRKGFRAELVTEAGLAKSREGGGGVYDAFRDRLIVPIRDDRHRVIGFGGRLLEGDGPKYINSPESPLYHKSHVLYGLDAARRAIGQRDRAILVEGYFDVLSMHQAGFEEAVATCGTALTAEHVEKIRRLTRNVVVLLDADEAGARAAERTLPMLEGAGIASWRLQLPDAKDPDELIREHGPAAMAAALDAKLGLLAWVAERKVRAHGYSAAGKERTRDELAELLGGISPPQASELSPILRIDERELMAWAKAWRPTTARKADAAPEEASLGWKPTREAIHLLWLLVHRHEQVADLVRRTDPGVLDDHPPLRTVVPRLVQGESVGSVLDDEHDLGVRRALTSVAARNDLYPPEESGLAMVDVLSRLARPQWEALSEASRSEAVRRAQAGDAAGAREAHARLIAVQQRNRALEAALGARDIPAALALLAPRDAEL